MGKHPILHYINEIKNKLGFSRTMTADGADVVDAVNKHSDQIATLLGTHALTGNVDFNAITQNGLIRIATSTATHNPNTDTSAFYGTLLNAMNNNYGTQIAYIANSQGVPTTYVRSTTAGSYTNSVWKKVINESDIVNNLTTDNATVALSAAMGKSLNDSKVPYLNIGVVSGHGAAWDAIPVYDRTVVGEFFKDGQWSFVAYKYSGSQYGTMLSMKFNGVLHFLSISNGNKTERTI